MLFFFSILTRIKNITNENRNCVCQINKIFFSIYIYIIYFNVHERKISIRYLSYTSSFLFFIANNIMLDEPNVLNVSYNNTHIL